IHYDIGAGLAESQRDCLADAGVRAGDQSFLPLQNSGQGEPAWLLCSQWVGNIANCHGFLSLFPVFPFENLSLTAAEAVSRSARSSRFDARRQRLGRCRRENIRETAGNPGNADRAVTFRYLRIPAAA